MALGTDLLMKHKTSELYSLCVLLFPEEFRQIYAASRAEFRDWLNLKTGLNVDHIINKHEAMDSWIEKLKSLSQSGK